MRSRLASGQYCDQLPWRNNHSRPHHLEQSWLHSKVLARCPARLGCADLLWGLQYVLRIKAAFVGEHCPGSAHRRILRHLDSALDSGRHAKAGFRSLLYFYRRRWLGQSGAIVSRWHTVSRILVHWTGFGNAHERRTQGCRVHPSSGHDVDGVCERGSRLCGNLYVCNVDWRLG